jgi:hypothetical protein
MKPFINTGNRNYNGRLEAFYENIPYTDLLNTLTKNTAVFLNELKRFEHFKHTQSEKFFLLYREKGWNTTMLYSYGLKYVNNCKKFPDTISLLQPYQNIVTIYFSTLESGTKIKPHFGDTDATYRIHLGLEIPAPLPDCGLEVGGLQKGWETGKTVIFNDAHFHSAWNLSSKQRTVLIIDVIRPEFLKRKQYISAGVLGAMGIGRTLYPLRIMDKLPNQLLIFLHLCSTYIFFIFLLIQNTFWNKKK